MSDVKKSARRAAKKAAKQEKKSERDTMGLGLNAAMATLDQREPVTLRNDAGFSISHTASMRVHFCYNGECEFATKPSPKILYCGGCPKYLKAQYCSRACQKLEWSTHKHYCKLRTLQERIDLDNMSGFEHTEINFQ